MIRFCFAICLLCMLHATVDAQEWSRFRGPNGTGVGKLEVPPVKWTDADYKWQAELPGVGNSSPVLWGNKLFLMSGNAETATRHLLCFNSESGELLWDREFESAWHKLNGRNTFGSSTPAVDDKHVYFAWSDPSATLLKAFDHDGNEVWSLNLGTWISQHGFGTSPMIYKNMVILFNSQQHDNVPAGQEPGDSKMMAFDRDTGRGIWSTPLRATRVCYGVPCIYVNEEGEDELIDFNTGNGVFSLNPMTGELNWEVPAFTMRTVASPVIAEGLILGSTGSGGGGNYLAAIRPGKKGEVAYQVKPNGNYVPTPITYEDMVFILGDKGIVTCFDAESGKVHWRERISTGFESSPVRVADKIYATDEKGTLYVIAASKDFHLLAENDLGEECRSTIAIANNNMYIRTNSKLMALEGK